MILLMQTPENLLAIRFVVRIPYPAGLSEGRHGLRAQGGSGTREVCPKFLNCVCETRHTGTATSVFPSPQCS